MSLAFMVHGARYVIRFGIEEMEGCVNIEGSRLNIDLTIKHILRSTRHKES